MQSLISSCALHIHKLVSLHHISASDIGAALLMHYQNKMQIRMSVLLCIAAAFTLPAELHAQSAAVSTSANVTGSLGYLCSSQAGILTALQHVAANSDTANLNVSIPADLSNAAAVQQVAQIAWEHIVTYAIPAIEKSVAGGSANGTKVNSFYLKSTHLSLPSDGGVTPNHDTIYSQAWLDLSQGPQIITVPEFDTPKRYWIVPFLDAYYNYWGAIGSTHNSSAGQYLVVGRGASANATYANFTSDRIFHAPTDLNFVIGRVLVLNDSDTAKAVNYSSAITVTPYNPAVNGSLNATSKAALASRAVNGSGYGPYGTNPTSFLDNFIKQPFSWFNSSSAYYGVDPPVNGTNANLANTLASLSRSAANNGSGVTNLAYSLAQQVARNCIINGNTAIVTSTGWTFHNTSGIYTRSTGTDYLLRAQDTRYIPAALPPQEVIYFLATKDAQGRTLDASTGYTYTLTFDLPVPASQFWSLTMYNATTQFLINNTINRYEIGDRTPGLAYSGTGNNTLVVYVAASAPANGTANAANWLPAPADAPFEFILRTYGPPASAIAGGYAPPAIVRSATPTTLAVSTAGK